MSEKWTTKNISELTGKVIIVTGANSGIGFEAAKELGVTITAYTPLAGGLLTGKLHNNPEALKKKFAMYRMVAKRNLEESVPLVETLTEIGKVHEVLPGQVALNWLVTYHGDTVVTIPGATKAYQAKESAGAMAFNLSKAELEEIAEASEIFLKKNL